MFCTINRVLADTLRKAGTDFCWSAVQVNHNTVESWHVDAEFQGRALIVGAGNYTGGEFEIEGSGALSIRGALLAFDTSVPHRSFSFAGQRFTFVFFQPGRCIELLTELLALGFGPQGLAEPPAPAPSECMTLPVQAPGRRGWRDLHDGAGLCSQGRWSLRERQYPGGVFLELTQWLRDRLLSWERQVLEPKGWNLQRMLFWLATNRCKEDFFGGDMVDQCRRKFQELLTQNGCPLKPSDRDRSQPLQVRLIQALLRAAGDPDVDFMDTLAAGVPLGVDMCLPRAPKIYDEKTSWNVKDSQPGEVPRSLENYASARCRPEVLLAQFEEEQREGLMHAVTRREAEARYPGTLVFGALGAIEKKPGSGDFRVIFDGTHSVLTNQRIRLSDQQRFPGIGDVEAVLHELSREQTGHFSLLYDVRKAHRNIPVREEDWGYQACRVQGHVNSEGEEMVWLNCVGTFGVASAAYWWGRSAGCVVARA